MPFILKGDIYMSNAEKCIQAVNKKIETNEYNTVTLKGVRNLSRSDLEFIKLYAEASIKGTLHSFMEPRGNIRDVLEKFKVAI